MQTRSIRCVIGVAALVMATGCVQEPQGVEAGVVADSGIPQLTPVSAPTMRPGEVEIETLAVDGMLRVQLRDGPTDDVDEVYPMSVRSTSRRHSSQSRSSVRATAGAVRQGGVASSTRTPSSQSRCEAAQDGPRPMVSPWWLGRGAERRCGGPLSLASPVGFSTRRRGDGTKSRTPMPHRPSPRPAPGCDELGRGGLLARLLWLPR